MANALKGKLVAAKNYDSSEPVKLHFEITNQGPVDLYVLKWNTPLEGLLSDCLHVLRNGKSKVEYDGPLVKRGNPSPNDYLLVPAGQTVSAEVNVSEAYAVSKPADYQVELNLQGLEHMPVPAALSKVSALNAAVEVKRTQSLTGGKVKFNVKKGAMQIPTRGEAARANSSAIAKAAPPAGNNALVGAAAAAPLPPNLIGGTATQKTQAKAAHLAGYNLCEAALSGLANDARYKEWYGTHTTPRFNKVKATLTKVRDRMKTVTFTYNLSGAGCQNSWYAYTHKGDTTIWLCGQFWLAPATGTDSKAGTMVHEHTHSDANTDDITYGQTSARSLAVSNPDKAIVNADNYEYFCKG